MTPKNSLLPNPDVPPMEEQLPTSSGEIGRKKKPKEKQGEQGGHTSATCATDSGHRKENPSPSASALRKSRGRK